MKKMSDNDDSDDSVIADSLINEQPHAYERKPGYQIIAASDQQQEITLDHIIRHIRITIIECTVLLIFFGGMEFALVAFYWYMLPMTMFSAANASNGTYWQALVSAVASIQAGMKLLFWDAVFREHLQQDLTHGFEEKVLHPLKEKETISKWLFVFGGMTIDEKLQFKIHHRDSSHHFPLAAKNILGISAFFRVAVFVLWAYFLLLTIIQPPIATYVYLEIYMLQACPFVLVVTGIVLWCVFLPANSPIYEHHRRRDSQQHQRKTRKRR